MEYNFETFYDRIVAAKQGEVIALGTKTLVRQNLTPPAQADLATVLIRALHESGDDTVVDALVRSMERLNEAADIILADTDADYSPDWLPNQRGGVDLVALLHLVAGQVVADRNTPIIEAFRRVSAFVLLGHQLTTGGAAEVAS